MHVRLDGSIDSETIDFPLLLESAAIVSAATLPTDALVDQAFYFAAHPDVAASGESAAANYHRVGWTLGYDPNAFFSTRYYLAVNPDVARAGIDPLAHYEQSGAAEGRSTSPAFSTQLYTAAYPAIVKAGLNPLQHFLTDGYAQGRSGTPGFDPASYLAHNPDVAAAGVDPLQHFLTIGWTEGRNPDALFNIGFYQAGNPDVAAAHIDPLVHYLQHGAAEGRDPAPGFSTQLYLAAYTDVARSGIDPLAHYLQYGKAEGRVATPGFDAAYYLAHNPDVAAARVDPLTHFETIGWKEGRAPDANFDPRYYLAENPDVAASGMDPLLHYLTFGWHEGRDPSVAFSTQGYLAANPDVARAGIDPLLHFLSNGTAEHRVVPAGRAGLGVKLALTNDTGFSVTDRITADASLTGAITNDPSRIAVLSASIDGHAAVDVLSHLTGTGIALDAAAVRSLAGGTIATGQHSVHLVATDVYGQTAATDLTFTLLAAPPPLSVTLASSDQLGTAASPAATAGRVTIVGTAAGGDTVALTGPGGTASTIAAANGTYTIANVLIGVGANAIAVNETDAAGNAKSVSASITGQTQSIGTDVVLTWDAITRAAITIDADAPTVASRVLAIESLAVYDTLSAINGTIGYAVSMAAPLGANVNAALAVAADAVLDQLFPSQAVTFDAALASQLAVIPDSQGKTDGIALGRTIAARELALRANDGSANNTTDYGSDAVGHWRPTPYAYAAATTPQWANVTPFGLTSSAQFRAPPPPDVTSAQYAMALAQVASLGSATSTTRTTDQTAIAKFWNDQTGTDTPIGQWNNIATIVAQAAGASVSQDARLFAMLNITLADATISAWNNKFFYDLWRPVTAIRLAGTDGNPTDASQPDPNWLPLLSTPAFPDYVEGHGTISAAAATVLASVFGDATQFTATSQSTPGVTRTYTSFSAAANDAAESRIYGGIHFQFSADAGLALGTQVGTYDVAQFNLASDTPPLVQLDAALPGITRTDPLIDGQVISKYGVVSLTASLDGAAFAPVTLQANGSFAIQPTLALDGSADGSHRMVFRGTSVTGLLSGPITYTFTLATQPATFTLSPASIQPGGTLAPGSVVAGSVALPAGDVVAKLGYSIDGAAARTITVDANGAFSQPLDTSQVGPGAHTVVLTETDAAGIVSTRSIAVTSALAPFRLTAISPANGATDQGVTFRPQIIFSRPVNPTTLTSASFYATDATGTVLPATLVPNQDGSSARMLFTNPIPGSSTITLHVAGALIRAAGDGALLDAAGTGAGSTLSDSYVTVSTTSVPGTTITGIIVDPGVDGVPLSPDDLQSSPIGTADWANDHWKLPIAGVKVYVLGQEANFVTTDANGRFNLTGVPSGDVKLSIDGRTATNAPSGFFFPEMVTDIQVTPGVINTVAGDMGSAAEQAANKGNPSVYLPRVANDAYTAIAATGMTTVTAPRDSSLGAGTFTLTPTQLAKLTLQVAGGSLVDANGNAVQGASVGISPVPPAIVQDMLPPGVLQHSFDITIQSGSGVVFNQPATLTMPNVFGLNPGDQTYMLGFNHTTGRLEVQGTATASADGLSVTSDPGAGVTQPGWHAMTAKLTHAKGGVTAPCPDSADVSNAQGDVVTAAGGLASDYQSILQGVDGALTLAGKGPKVFGKVAGPVANVAGFIEDGNTAVTNLRQNVNDAVRDGFFSWSTAILFTQGLSDSLNVSLDVIGSAASYLGPTGKTVAAIATVTRATTAFIDASDSTSLGDSVNKLNAVNAANPCPPSTPNPTPGPSPSPDRSPLLDMLAGLPVAPAADPAAAPAAAPLTGDIAADIAAARALRPIYNAILADTNILAPLGTLDYTRDDLGLTPAQSAALAATAPTLLAALRDLLAQTTALTKMPSITALGADIIQSADAQFATLVAARSQSLQPYVALLNQSEAAAFAYQYACLNAPPNTQCVPPIELLIQSRLYQQQSDAGFAATIGSIHATMYAVLQGPDGNTQRFTFNYIDGIDYYLSPNTSYKLTVYDALVNKIGTTTFVSAASAKDTVIPNVTLFTDTGPAGADGLSSQTAFVIGVDNTKTGNLVGGQTDLSVLKSGGAAATLATQTGVVASLSLTGTAQAVALAGSTVNPNILTAFVALGSAGLAIVDVSNRLKPILLNTIATGGTAVDVAFDDTTGLVAVATTNGLAIVTSGMLPMVVATLAIKATHVLAVDGLAYVAVGGSIDVVSLQGGAVQQQLRLGSAITGLAREGRYLYAIDTAGTLRVLDLSASALVQVGSVTVPAGGNRITVGNGIAYVGNANATFTGGYATVNVANPAAPVVIEGVDDTTIASASIALAGPGTAISAQSFSIGGPPVGYVDVLNTANSSVTSNRSTRYTLTGQQAYDVKIGNGVAFVAAGTGLDVINYIAADTTGIAPTVAITQAPVDVDPLTDGIQVYEGNAITLGINATDNVQVRNTELLIDGVVDENAVSYPFSLGAILPTIIANGGRDTLTLQVRAFDTGGNTADSAPVVVHLVHDTRPLVVQTQSVVNGAHLPLSLNSINFTFNRALNTSVQTSQPVTITAPDGSTILTGTVLRGSGRTLEVDFTPAALGAYTVHLNGALLADAAGFATGTSETFGFVLQNFTDTFVNTQGGDWNTGANWSTGAAPGSTDSAFIGGNIQGIVTYGSGAATLASLTMDAAAQLTMSGGALTLTGQSELSTIAMTDASLTGGTVEQMLTVGNRNVTLNGVGTGSLGSIQVSDNQAATIAGSLANAGSIVLATQGSYTALLTAGAVSLTGGGTVVMNDGDARLNSNGAASTLTNVDNTIGGAGSIGDDANFAFVNQGVVNASSAGRALILGAESTALVNTGTLEATAPGGLLIRNLAVTNTGGTIQALTGGQVQLQAAAITGGRLHTAGTGTITAIDRNTVLDGVADAAGDTVGIADNNTLTLRTSFTNGGTLAVKTAGSYTALLTSGAVTLQGGGTVRMASGGDSRIQGTGTLTNLDNTITGGGSIGDDSTFNFINRAKVDASGTQGLILGTESVAMVNIGTLQASGTGGMLLRNVAITNAGGTIQALNGSSIALQSTTITGGRLHTVGTGAINAIDRGTVLDSVVIGAGDKVGINDNNTLTLTKGLINAGTVAVNTVGSYTALLVSGAVSLQGGGTVTLGSGGDSRIQGSGTLTNTDNTITGAGTIGNDNSFGFVNRGVVNASSASQQLVVAGALSMVNAGLMEATGAGGLLLSRIALDNAAGRITAAANATVRLQSAAITGGHINAAIGGTLEIIDRGSVLDGVTIDAGSQVTIDDNQALTLVNNQNMGAFTLASAGSYTALLVSGAVTLSGSTVTMQGGGSQLQGAGTLTSTDTITGAGTIGNDSSFGFVNRGVVNASSASQQLVVAGARSLVNAGLMEATGAGGLLLSGIALDNTAGQITAAANATVRLRAASITGGHINTAPGGKVEVIDRSSVLDGVTVDVGSQVTIDDNQALTLLNNQNNGAFTLASAGSYTALLVSGAVGLTGSIVTMQDGAAQLQGAGMLTSTNTSTIVGAGLIGDDAGFTFINHGLVNASSAARALVIGSGATAVTNTGTLEATGAGGLLIRGQTVTNTNGLIQALDGAAVILQTATITGGRLHTAGTGTIAASNRSVVLDNVTTQAGDTVTISDNQALTLVHGMTNGGTITLNTAGSYTALLTSGAVAIQGGGTIRMGTGGGSTIQGAGTLTNVDETITGGGVIGDDGAFAFINQGTVDASAAQALVIGSGATAMVNSGTMQATGAGGMLIRNQTVTNTAGLIQAFGGSTISLQAATITGGRMQTTGTSAFVAIGRGSVLDGVSLGAGDRVAIGDNNALTLHGTVSNAGTIAVGSVGSYTALLTSGAVTLSGGGAVTLTPGASVIQSNGTTTLTNADNTISGTGTIGDGAFTLINAGTIGAATGQFLTINTAGPIQNTGLLRSLGAGALTVANALTGQGAIEIGGSGTITLAAAVGAQQAVRFDAGATGTLVLQDSQDFAGTIVGLAADKSNAIDLADIRASTAAYSYAGSATAGTLTVSDGTRTATLHLLGDYTHSTFALSQDAGTGTLVRDPAAAASFASIPSLFTAPESAAILPPSP